MRDLTPSSRLTDKKRHMLPNFGTLREGRARNSALTGVFVAGTQAASIRSHIPCAPARAMFQLVYGDEK